MWFVSFFLMAAWMICLVLGFRLFGLEHMLGLGAVVIEVLRPGRPRRPAIAR
jgi:hypothetical protein